MKCNVEFEFELKKCRKSIVIFKISGTGKLGRSNICIKTQENISRLLNNNDTGKILDIDISRKKKTSKDVFLILSLADITLIN